MSAGAQFTEYDFTDSYMEDISFNVSSCSVGLGVGIKLTEKMKTFYKDYKRETNDYYNISGLAGKVIGNVANELLGPEAAQVAVDKTTALLTTPDPSTGKSMLYGADTFTRTNRVFGIGLDIDF